MSRILVLWAGESTTPLDLMPSPRITLQPVSNDTSNTTKSSRYPLTKLIEIFACRHLASLIPVSKTGVVLNYVSPGLCYTNLNTKGSDKVRKMVDEQRELFFGRTAEMGSRTLLASAVLGRDSHGLYNSSCEVQDDSIPEWIKDEEGNALQKKIWESIAQELERVVPGCVEKALS
jgi:hypothetical protein